MSNDPRDDAMREIEAALDEFHQEAACMDTQWIPKRDKLLALIRSKLPQPDAEHERAVEAWEKRAAMIRGEINKERHYVIRESDIDEALRLMRARPAPHTFYGGTERSYAELVAKEEAAGELLRAAKAAVDYRTARTVDQVELVLNCLRIQIAKAERAGIKP